MPEARKIVTALFADITGSTVLGEQLDPESLRHVLSRYFDEMQRVIERHGGLVTKFVGDAVMAVFGIPVRHEDDALRAARAAIEMRARLGELNAEFAASYGVTVAVRTGLNTGEVLATEPTAAHTLVVGDAVNVAARLEQAAEPGEILIGDATYRLVESAVSAERAGPLELKGKSAPTVAWRLLDVTPDVAGRTRRLDSVLIGRERDLARIEDSFRRVADHGTCELVTLMGPAGVGKSRLTAELVARTAAEATVLQGRCLPYGEGITYWPVASIVMAAIGSEERDSQADARDKVAQLLDDLRGDAAEDALILDGLASLLGPLVPDAGIQETSWAVRRLLERLAGRGPLMVVFDDIHWGEPTFLDLLDYLADRVQAPVLILCQARPELLEARPEWMTGKPNASTITLAPLGDTEIDLLIRGLVAGSDLPLAARSRIAEVAEGNPLFVEETLRMLIDDGALQQVDGRWMLGADVAGIAIPPTILALLAARLDRLEPEQRAVIERASVIGRSFWWGAVAELSPPEARPRIGACLQSLVRKELIRPDRSEIRGEDAFRFAHILVRDAAYNGLPKAIRAELHERLADWIERHARDVAGEYEEIVAYHLEQAHRARLELAPPDERTAALAERAAERLGAAGRRAYERGDMPAAVTLITRATGLLPRHHPRRLELLPELAFARLEVGDFDGLVAAARELERSASETADVRLQAHAQVIGLWIRAFTEPDGMAAVAGDEGRRAIAIFRELEDERGLARAWSLLGLVGMLRARFGPALEAWTNAVEHAQRAGQRRDALEGLTWVAAATWLAPVPAEEATRRCRDVLDRAQGDRKAMSTALFCLASLEADAGRFAEAGELFARSRALLQEVALPVWDAGALSQALGWALLLEGRPADAEQELRRAYDTLREVGEAGFFSTVAGILAEAIYAQGRYAEAAEFSRVSEASAGAEDVYSQAGWRAVRAKCLAQEGAHADAVALARECVEIAARSDSPGLHWQASMSEAEVLRLAGRPEEAHAAARDAARAAEVKGSVVGARLAREALVTPPVA